LFCSETVFVSYEARDCYLDSRKVGDKIAVIRIEKLWNRRSCFNSNV